MEQTIRVNVEKVEPEPKTIRVHVERPEPKTIRLRLVVSPVAVVALSNGKEVS
jgi:hypothetical protein